MTEADLLEARRVLHGEAGTEADRQAIDRICRDDPVAFMACGLWVRRIKVTDADGVERPVAPSERLQPFIPWPGQVKAIREMVACVESGRDLILAKSRDLGASTIATGLAVWGWLWHRWDALLCSRTEDDVDRAGDPDTLFAKVDHAIRWLPRRWLPCSWDLLRPGPQARYRRHLILEHPEGHAIAGEATTAHIGRGARKTLVAFDEAAAQERFAAGWRSAADTTISRWAISTHLAGSHFSSTLWPQAESTGDPTPIQITYADDPGKGAGAEERVDTDGSVTGDAGRRYVWTPWLQRELARRDLQDMRENVLALPTTAGRGFFPAYAIERMRGAVSSPRRCETVQGTLVDNPSGRWRVWEEPSERTSVVVFLDPAYGTGAANAAACVMDAERRSLIAMYVDPHTPPYDLAREVTQACRSWARGRYTPMIGWEVNGPGASLHHDFKRLRHDRVYRQRQVGNVSERQSVRVGWMSTRQAKRTLFGDLSRAMAEGTVHVPDAETLAELEQTIVYADGGIGPARLEMDVNSTAREAHGDRVVALAGALMLCDEAAGTPAHEKSGQPRPWSMAAVLGIEETPKGYRPID